jgi:hypothetical protein
MNPNEPQTPTGAPTPPPQGPTPTAQPAPADPSVAPTPPTAPAPNPLDEPGLPMNKTPELRKPDLRPKTERTAPIQMLSYNPMDYSEIHENTNRPPVDMNDPNATQKYLNDLAAKPAPKKFFDKKTMIIGGVVVGLFLIVIIIIASSNSKTPDLKQSIAKAAAEYTNVMNIIDYGSQNLTEGSSLSRANATSALVLGTQSAKFTALNGKTKLSKEAKKAIANPSVDEKSLDSAKAAGNLDSVYRETLGNYLATVTKSLKTIQSTKTTAANKTMAKQYLAEINTLKSRLEIGE